MKTPIPASVFTASLAFALLSSHAAESAGGTSAASTSVATGDGRSLAHSEDRLPAGSISGRVSNKSTNAFLEGARVELRPSSQTTLTGRDGSYTFSRVAPGLQTVTIFYTGLDSQAITLQVESGRATLSETALTSAAYQLDAFVVSGEREGNARAITDQRNAANVKNVLSSDAFGNVADQNIGSLLLRVPGVAGVPVEGEIVALNIRGVDSNLNAVTVDGTRVGNGSTRGALGRAFSIDTFPADFVDRIEVTKAPTPDMDADSIGGSINLKTKSAFSQRGRLSSFQVGTSYAVERKTFDPQASFLYSDLVGKKRNLGILVTANYSARTGPRDVNLNNWESKADAGVAYFWLLNGGEDYLTMKRGGLSVRFDYRLNEQSTFYLSLLGSRYHARMWRHHNNFTGVTAATVLPGYTEFITDTRNITYTANHINRERDTNTYNFQVGGESTLVGFKIDYNFNFSPADGSETLATIAPTVAGVGMRFDRSKLRSDYGSTTFTQISGPDIANPANLRLNAFSISDVSNEDRFFGGQVNVRKPFDLPVPAYIQTGLRFRSQDPTLTNRPITYNYVGPTGAAMARLVDTEYVYQPAVLRGTMPSVRFFGLPAVRSEMETNPANFRIDNVTTLRSALMNDRQASESVYAAYVMGGVTLGRLQILSGLRFEETRVEGSGTFQFISAVEKARRAAWVGPVTETETLRRTQAEYGNRVTNRSEYRNVFPGIHFRYLWSRQWQARLSYSAGIGRPAFSTIIPNNSVNDTSLVVTTNNTGLKPQTGDNFDASLEYYFEPSGLLSVSVFLKEIKGFIYTAGGATIPTGADNGFGGEYAGYLLNTQYNGGSARVRGIEANYQQQFTNLPGFWQGFGIFANGTWLDTVGNYDSAPGVTNSGREVPGFTPFTANLGVSYIRTPWTIRIKENFKGRAMLNRNANPLQNQYNYGRKFIDVNLGYSITPRYSLYVDVINVFGDSLSGGNFVYIVGRPRGPDRFNAEIKAGVTGRF